MSYDVKMESDYLECNLQTILPENRRIMVYLGFKSIAPFILCIVAGLSNHTVTLKSGSPISGISPISSHSIAPHPLKTSVFNSKISNLTDEPRFQCSIRYGASLVKESCLDAIDLIPEEPMPYIFGRRTRAHVQIGLPYRFMSCTFVHWIPVVCDSLRTLAVS